MNVTAIRGYGKAWHVAVAELHSGSGLGMTDCGLVLQVKDSQVVSRWPEGGPVRCPDCCWEEEDPLEKYLPVPEEEKARFCEHIPYVQALAPLHGAREILYVRRCHKCPTATFAVTGQPGPLPRYLLA